MARERPIPLQDALVGPDAAASLRAGGLAREPTETAELPLAQDALRVGDRQMDSAFALAVADATENPPRLSADAKKIELRLQRAEDALAAAQAQVARLTASEAKATGSRCKDSLGDQLSLANAQLELRQDEVDDAKQDLIGAGGDPQDRIQQLVEEHQAAAQVSDATKVDLTASVQPHGLIQRYQEWSVLHKKQLQLWRAKRDATKAAAMLAHQAQLPAAANQRPKRKARTRARSGTRSATSSGPNVPDKNPADRGGRCRKYSP